MNCNLSNGSLHKLAERQFVIDLGQVGTFFWCTRGHRTSTTVDRLLHGPKEFRAIRWEGSSLARALPKGHEKLWLDRQCIGADLARLSSVAP